MAERMSRSPETDNSPSIAPLADPESLQGLDAAPLPLPEPESLPEPDDPGTIRLADGISVLGPGPLKSPVLTTPAAEAYAPNDEYCRYTRVYRSVFLSRLWFRGEYLAWTTKGQTYPALVTSSRPEVPVTDAGDFQAAATSILFGDQVFHDQLRSGGRLTVGYWWDQSQWGGVEFSYFGVDGHDTQFYDDERSGRVLARPFFDVYAGVGDSLPVSYPGVIDGAIDVEADMEFSGAEFLFRRMGYLSPSARVDLVAGYRYGRLVDQLGIEESLLPLDASSGLVPGTIVHRRDLFRSENEFHGGQLGVIADWIGERWGLRVLGKVGLGATHAANSIAGSTTTIDLSDDSVTVAEGGLLALPTNIGGFSNTRFATFSELGISADYYFGCQLKISAGYTLVYWTELTRTGQQVSLEVNPTQIGGGALVGPPLPGRSQATTDFWAQGFTLGFEYLF
jgi:hypothetical protein